MIYIEDNYFKDPYAIRNLALKKRYVSEKFNYPGVRSAVPSDISNNIFSKIKYVTQDSNLILSSSDFQCVTKKFGEGIIHRDDFKYICIIYLSLEPPANSGTEVCDYDQDIDTFPMPEVLRRKTEFFEDPENLIKRFTYARLRRWKNSHYKPMIKVPNKFNRFILFPARRFHRAQNSFGTSIENARLTLVSFVE